VFFCGYSFPDADIHIKYLFERAEIHQGNPPEIFVINGSRDWSTSPFREEGERFSRFFGRTARVELTQLSFEEFCSAGVPPK
jgi:hypothetical protein